MPEEKQKTTEKKQEERFEVVEVPTQMGLAFKDNETDEILEQMQLLSRMANDVSEIKKGIVGGK